MLEPETPPPWMDRKRVQYLALAVIVLFAAVLRLYDLKNLPAGLFCDEAAMGYNAYAIGTTGIDENGASWPLFIWSFGGYKNPTYIYPAALPIRFLGLDEFTTRLPAALYGTGTVVAIFFLGRALFTPWVGLFAAALLTICPWHLHFSRIAFELISFPFLFITGLTLLARYTQGRRTLPAAMFFFSLCLYAYAIAAVFVPLFLLGFSLLYVPTLLRRWGQTILALLVIAATVAPIGVFYYRHPQGTSYAQHTTWVRWDQPVRPQLETFRKNYLEFFSQSFLFQRGDPIARHAVRGNGFGELLPFFAPLILLGAALMAVWPDRFSKLLLWWLAVYPVGPSLMTEIPTATRSMIGAPAFCFLAAIAVAAVLRAAGWLLRWRPLALTVQTAAVAAGVVLYVAPQFQRYWHEYTVEYPKYSAPSAGGFQYGFRELISVMDPLRSQYKTLLISTTDGNQNQIFPMFYRHIDPREWIRSHDPGYLILDPAEYRRYSLDQGALYAVKRSDLDMFSDYTIKHTVVAPGGQEEFFIADIRQRKQYLTDWLVLGVFSNRNGQGVRRDFIDLQHIKREKYQGLIGDVIWRKMMPQFIRVDLNSLFAGADPASPGNPEYVCAYALETITAPAPQSAFLELSGSDDFAQVWLNGQMLTPGPMLLGGAAVRRPVDLARGSNLLVIKSCESIGSWYFTARITDAAGRDVPGLRADADLPREEAPAPVVVKPPGEAVQLVEGFASIVRFLHTDKRYADYRGGTESWWAYGRDTDGEVVWLSARLPEKRTSTLAFTASMGEEAGEGELWINGQYALTFNLGVSLPTNTWQRGAYQLSFVAKGMAGGNSGYFLLTVPAEAVTPGQPLEMRVTFAGGSGSTWFMMKNYADTITHEGLTPESVVADVRETWKSVR